MSDLFQWLTEYGDKVGIASLLIVAVSGLTIVIKRLYQDRIDCDEARLKTSEDIGELKGSLGALEMKVEMQELSRDHHLRDLEHWHRNVLEAVLKNNN